MDSGVTVVCPNPSCNTTFPMAGMLDLGFLPDTGFPQGTTDGKLSMDCPACRTHLELQATVSWRPPDVNHV